MPSEDAPDGPRRIGELVDPDRESSVPIAHEALAEAAEAAMAPDVRDFVVAGAGSSETVRENRAAFRRRRIVPRTGRDVADRDLGVELFGRRHDSPLLLAPIGGMGHLDDDGELAAARAARAESVPMVLSTVASRSIEAVADELGDSPRWFQLYWLDDEAVVESLVGRAERAGYGAIVLTVDTPVPPWREATLERGQVSPPGEPLANFVSDPVVAERLDVDPGADPERALEQFQALRRGTNVTWADVDRLRELTDLSLLVKGVLRPGDARRAIEAGADGVVVSNHGGRQIEGSIAALDALPAVVDAVGADGPVLFDSGIRRGADVFVALALGADAVLIGRPYLYGLAIAGEDGVRDVLANLRADLDLTMGMAGYRAPGEIDGDAVLERGERPEG